MAPFVDILIYLKNMRPKFKNEDDQGVHFAFLQIFRLVPSSWVKNCGLCVRPTNLILEKKLLRYSITTIKVNVIRWYDTFSNISFAVIETLLYADARKCWPISTSPKCNVQSVFNNTRGPPFYIHGNLLKSKSTLIVKIAGCIEFRRLKTCI